MREQLLRLLLGLVVTLVPATVTEAAASSVDPWAIDWLHAAEPESGLRSSSTWQVAFPVAQAPRRPLAVALTLADQAGQDQPAPRPKAFEYSHGYEVRRKIHVYASFATLPLFITQIALGSKLYDTPEDGTRTAHAIVGSSIGVLFGLNTVTGLWNLKEGWQDPSHRKLRLAHGLLMLGADAGFVATGLLAPDKNGNGDRATHRAVALTSIGVATTGYLLMLFAR